MYSWPGHKTEKLYGRKLTLNIVRSMNLLTK